MDKSLELLCDALKKIFAQLKPQSNPLSFVLLTGKTNQGKTALLRQSNLIQQTIESDAPATIFYNSNGVILELGESWINRSENLLTFTLKQLNRCSSLIKINGLVLCIDAGELLQTEAVHLISHCKSHTQLIERFGEGLGYKIDTSILFTKLDSLAGFCEFFQSEHMTELSKPLGFSVEYQAKKSKFIENYQSQFDQMLEVLGQQIISKLHPARSSVKRTLIREFPLQLASLRVPIQALIQQLNPNFFKLQALYFTSAEQGGMSIDRLNSKIQHEYALTIQDRFPQSNNYKAYFIEGAVKAIQDQTKRYPRAIPIAYKSIAGAAAAVVGIVLCTLAYQHITTTRLLDNTSRELLAYETLIAQPDTKTAALYHLSLAETHVDLIPNNIFTLAIINQLKRQLHINAKNSLINNFMPDLITGLESVITNPSQSQLNRYQALKIYIMLGNPEHFVEKDIVDWYTKFWNTKNSGKPIDRELMLLRRAIKQPMQAAAINHQLVSDVRNYMNALPAAYLYYSLAKNYFPQEKKSLQFEGFDLTNKELPVYYTKAGFKQVIALLPEITEKLQKENWILARQDLSSLQSQLEQAYTFEYVTWWQNFISRTRPQHYQGYQQARKLTQMLEQTDSIANLVTLIQQQTSPDLSGNSNLFNQEVASQFTSLNLMSNSLTRDLSINISELEKFLTTLALVSDQGRTVFELTKSRFAGESVSDPLSALYNKARQLPEPVSTWAKQIADDTWFIFITESRGYINKQWQRLVFEDYQTNIADRYPLNPNNPDHEVNLEDFDHFFSPQGTFNGFVTAYLKPFLDVTKPQWQPKELNGYVMPISADLINELIRANVISNMFFPEESKTCKIDFTLQKINLDPVVASLQLSIGDTKLTDTQNSDSYALFSWPQSGAKLVLYSIEGNHFELEENGPWAFFKILQKVNVLVDSNDSASLQILFEVNGNSGRYLLKTQNQINPFSPGILSGFNLSQDIA